MRTPTFDELIDLHLQMQLGCYFVGISMGPRGLRYAWSDIIADTAWNTAFATAPLDSDSLSWIGNISELKGRKPAFLSEPALGSLGPAWAVVEATKERWMTRTLVGIKESPSLLTLSAQTGPVPQDSFLHLFTQLFADKGVNKHFREVYAPALASARANKAVEVIHYVGYHNAIPVSCASIYIVGEVAGLYNVGTDIKYQKRGYGRDISTAALLDAKARGCKLAFLQCEVNTHVEMMYSSIGFEISNTPTCYVVQRV